MDTAAHDTTHNQAQIQTSPIGVPQHNLEKKSQVVQTKKQPHQGAVISYDNVDHAKKQMESKAQKQKPVEHKIQIETPEDRAQDNEFISGLQPSLQSYMAPAVIHQGDKIQHHKQNIENKSAQNSHKTDQDRSKQVIDTTKTEQSRIVDNSSYDLNYSISTVNNPTIIQESTLRPSEESHIRALDSLVTDSASRILPEPYGARPQSTQSIESIFKKDSAKSIRIPPQILDGQREDEFNLNLTKKTRVNNNRFSSFHEDSLNYSASINDVSISNSKSNNRNSRISNKDSNPKFIPLAGQSMKSETEIIPKELKYGGYQGEHSEVAPQSPYKQATPVSEQDIQIVPSSQKSIKRFEEEKQLQQAQHNLVHPLKFSSFENQDIRQELQQILSKEKQVQDEEGQQADSSEVIEEDIARRNIPTESHDFGASIESATQVAHSQMVQQENIRTRVDSNHSSKSIKITRKRYPNQNQSNDKSRIPSNNSLRPIKDSNQADNSHEDGAFFKNKKGGSLIQPNTHNLKLKKLDLMKSDITSESQVDQQTGSVLFSTEVQDMYPYKDRMIRLQEARIRKKMLQEELAEVKQQIAKIKYEESLSPAKPNNKLKEMINISDNHQANLKAIQLVNRLQVERRRKQREALEGLQKVDNTILDQIGELTRIREERAKKDREQKQLEVLARMQQQEKRKEEERRLKQASNIFVRQVMSNNGNLNSMSSVVAKQSPRAGLHKQPSRLDMKIETPELNRKKEKLNKIRNLHYVSKKQEKHHNNNAYGEILFRN